MRQRHGFTLVEMMVTMALTLFVMVILSQAFVAALDTFRGLKAVGDMEQGLRTALNNLRFDLQQYHFERKRRLSDRTFGAPDQGFFYIKAPASTDEGADSGYVTAPFKRNYRAADHVLHFSVRLKGNRRESFLTAKGSFSPPLLGQPPADASYQATGNTNGQWAEIAYFLIPQGSTDSPNQLGGSGTPLYKLYRSQFLVVPTTTQSDGITTINGTYTLNNPNAGDFMNLSCIPDTANGNKLTFFTPIDLTTSTKRTVDPANPRYPRSLPSNSSDASFPDLRGATLLLSSVVSFNVRVQKNNYTPGGTLPWVPEADFDVLATYDSNSIPSASDVAQYRINALEISLRVWDAKTQRARQITMIQDM